MKRTREPPPVAPGDTVEVEVTDLAYGGHGVGRVAGGFVLFVEGALAGERIRARVRRLRGGHAEGECAEVLRASPMRVEPPCRHFARCGGCDLQHLSRAGQAETRRTQIAALMERLAGCDADLVAPVVEVGGGPAYRFRMDFDLGKAEDGSMALGLHRRRAPGVIEPLTDCLVLPETANAVRNWLAATLGAPATERGAPTARMPPVRRVSIQIAPVSGDMLLRFETDGGISRRLVPLARDLRRRFPSIVGVVAAGEERPGRPRRSALLAGRDHLRVAVDADTLMLPAGVFFQPNVHGWTTLRRVAVDLLDPRPQDHVLELYAGVGFFTLPLARRASVVVAVEGRPEAAAAARVNLAEAGLRGGRVVCREVAAALPDLVRDRRFAAALVDPPRAGLAPRSARLLAASSIERLVYVSCDPATLARDLGILTATGRFRAREVVPLDLFPHTHHVECVARLTR